MPHPTKRDCLARMATFSPDSGRQTKRPRESRRIGQQSIERINTLRLFCERGLATSGMTDRLLRYSEHARPGPRSRRGISNFLTRSRSKRAQSL